MTHGFTNRRFKYCAPHLYSNLPKKKLLANYKKTKVLKNLKTHIFNKTFELKTETTRDWFAKLRK